VLSCILLIWLRSFEGWKKGVNDHPYGWPYERIYLLNVLSWEEGRNPICG